MEKYTSIKNWAHDDKPREKMLDKGKEALSNAELLAILLGNGTKSKSAVDLARDILNLVQNNLDNLAKLGITDLTKVHGVGPAKAVAVMAAIELGGRRSSASMPQKSIINGSDSVYAVFGPLLRDKAYEEFWILLLNRRNQILKPIRISEGGISSTVVDPKKIFKKAVENGASNIVLCHNHPSGNDKPSEEDIQITKKICAAGDLMDIRVLDHLIVTPHSFYSFADHGIMP